MSLIRLLFVILFIPLYVCSQQIVNLSCNYDKDPISVDDLAPRLSWQIVSSKQGTRQTAYRILVASSVVNLSENKGDVWDSKKVLSDQSLYIPYQGNSIGSGEKYYWKVMIWDESGNASAWSNTAIWHMGLLNQKDWTAKWITASKWFTSPEFRPVGFQLSPKGGWADVDLGKSMSIEMVKLFIRDSIAFPSRFQILGSDEFNFIHHTILVDHTKQDYKIRKVGEQVFPVTKASYRFIRLKVVGNSENKSTTIRQMQVFSQGKDVALMKFTREQGNDWDHGHATFLVDGMPSEKEGAKCPVDACPSTAAPLLRKTFTIRKKIKEATVYFAALGMVDLTINGQKPGNEVLMTPFTDYYKRVMYASYDITRLLNEGKNVFGAVLANGFFSTPSLGFGQRHNGNGPPRFLLQAQIQYTDGSKETIISDPSWKWSRSEITFNDVWTGYSEDRNLQKPGWDQPVYNDENWINVNTAKAPEGRLVAMSGPRNRINDIIKPISIKDNHAYFETASVGWPLLKVNAKAGDTIVITGKGPGYVMARLSFIIALDGPTILSPKFIIQPGPTDIQVDGLKVPLTANDISIQYVSADLKETGSFSCSNPYLNHLFEVANRTHRNYINDFPADPNREKQGWTQDVQNMFNTAAYFTDVRDLYSRWWNDMEDSQDDIGYLGSVVPLVNRQEYGWNSPWWSGMIVFLPWEHYLYYGNKQILEKGYVAMRKYVDFLSRMAVTGEGSTWYAYPYFTENLDTTAAKEKMIIWNGAGDWNNPYTNTQHAVPTPVTTMPAWYYFAQVVSKTAAMLGKHQDSIKYALMALDVKDRFNKKYFNPATGLYGDSTNSQTAQVLPLAVGMVPDQKSDLTYKRLIDAIHLRNDHIGTGFTSINFLLQTLASHRESALANKIVNQKDYPSWNTLTDGGVFKEDWHGGNAQMPSCGGAVGAWLFQSVLGIQPDEKYPGFKQFILSPQPDPSTGLLSAKGYYECGYGKISVDWKCLNGNFIIDMEIPVNTQARLQIPDDNAPERLNVRLLGSGKYHFETKYKL